MAEPLCLKLQSGLFLTAADIDLGVFQRNHEAMDGLEQCPALISVRSTHGLDAASAARVRAQMHGNLEIGRKVEVICQLRLIELAIVIHVQLFESVLADIDLLPAQFLVLVSVVLGQELFRQACRRFAPARKKDRGRNKPPRLASCNETRRREPRQQFLGAHHFVIVHVELGEDSRSSGKLLLRQLPVLVLVKMLE